MKRLPVPVTAATFGTIAALSASMAYWGMQLFKEQQRPIAAVVHQAPPEPTIEAAKGLFGGDVAVAVASNYQLRGVVAPTHGRQGVAIIAADGKPPAVYPIGKEIDGATVQEVGPRHVVLLERGVPKRIELPLDAPSSGGGAAAMLPPLPSPGAPPAMQAAPTQAMPVPQNMPPPQTPMTGGAMPPPPRQ